MTEGYTRVSRKTLLHERIAICPLFDCMYIKKVKPLKIGFLGFHRYPKCKDHKHPLVFIDEFSSNFLEAIESCFFDRSCLPPKELVNLFKDEIPDQLETLIYGYLYAAPIGRGALAIPRYMEELSKGYLKSLTNKQQRLIFIEESKKYRSLSTSLKVIEEKYSEFLNRLRTKYSELIDFNRIKPFSERGLNIIRRWLETQCGEEKLLSIDDEFNVPLSSKKNIIDEMLHQDICSILLQKEPINIFSKISPFELFFLYQNFLNEGLCVIISKKDIDSFMKRYTFQKNESTSINNNIFNIDNKKMKTRKCSRCKQNLPLIKFRKYSGSRGKSKGVQSYRSICKDCEKLQKLIGNYTKKFRIIHELFSGICAEKDTDLIYLPSFEFHHPYPELKTASWRVMQNFNYENILEWVRKDKVIPLCGNCHQRVQAKYYNMFEDLIMTKGLFRKSPPEIDKLIEKSLEKKKLTRKSKRGAKYQIKTWIRKRYIIDTLFEGKCIGCKIINTSENLPAFEFHHKDSEIKQNVWDEIKHLDVEDIIEIIFKEEIIPLCSNCHSLIESKYYLYIEEILESYQSAENISSFKARVLTLYNKITKNIEKFSLDQEKLDYYSPLKQEFSTSKEIHNKYLLEIYYLLKIFKRTHVRANEINYLLHYTYPKTYRRISTLIEKGYMKEESHNSNKYYSITQKGRDLVKELRKNYTELSEMVERNLNSKLNWEISNVQGKLMKADILFLYPFIIYKIIVVKGFNEFTVIDIVNNTTFSKLSVQRSLKTLLEENIIKEIKNPIYTSVITTTKIYELTNASIEFVLKHPFYSKLGFSY